MLNVGQGDSIVIRFPDGSWAVVDSNIPPGQHRPPALELLKYHHVERLSFICLTHPHEDHYTGLMQLLENFEGRVGEFWVFPVDSQHRRKFLTRQYEKKVTRGAVGKAKYTELESIFRALVKMENADSGRYLSAGFRIERGGVEIHCLGPLSSDISSYQTALAQSKGIEDYTANENLISLVLRLRYAGNSILLSSDAPKMAWQKIWKKAMSNHETFFAEAVKVSHHGANSGHHGGIWEHTRSAKGTHAAISFGLGYGHPHPEVIQSLHELGVYIHCTNYPEFCQRNRPLDISKFRGLSSTQRLTLLMLDKSRNRTSSPCNGDVLFEFGPDGTIHVQNQYDNFCPFHVVAA